MTIYEVQIQYKKPEKFLAQAVFTYNVNIFQAFSVYLHCILQRLSDFDDAKDDSSQIELVLKFLQKASLSLREPYTFKAPSCKLSGKDRAAIVAKDLNEFLAHYRYIYMP